MADVILKECVVIGAGISGIAVSRWLKEYNIDFVTLERSKNIGGLWCYRESDYGVMKFTHINVSKYNYRYSDHAFPEKTIDYPHHSEMLEYVRSYYDKHELSENFLFETSVVEISEIEKEKQDEYFSQNLNGQQPKFENIKDYDRLWIVKTEGKGKTQIYVTPFVSVATGHHGTPVMPEFPGQNTFNGEIIHSVKYKNATFNKMLNKRVLVVGIGNSGVDVADNLYQEGGCEVTISTRSGAWIIPNYISGFPIDLYACRYYFNQPFKMRNFILESTIKFISGDPKNYNLNPKMKALQTQPTLCPTLLHHIQRNHIKITANIKEIKGSLVLFENGDEKMFDAIIMCTGYRIDLDFLHKDLQDKIFNDQEQTKLNLYKRVFHPEIGKSLSFIGFVQPSSGGLLAVSEIQARWFVYLMLNKIKLPSIEEMKAIAIDEQKKIDQRFHKSQRHTLQCDPLEYNDEIAATFDAKPNFIANPSLLQRLLFSSCGPAQWRLNGIDQLIDASEEVKKVPLTTMMKFISFLLLIVLLLIIVRIIQHPYLSAFFLMVGTAFWYFDAKSKIKEFLKEKTLFNAY